MKQHTRSGLMQGRLLNSCCTSWLSVSNEHQNHMQAQVVAPHQATLRLPRVLPLQVRDLVSRSAKSDHLRQLQRMHYLAGVLPHQLFIIENVTQLANHYITYGALPGEELVDPNPMGLPDRCAEGHLAAGKVMCRVQSGMHGCRDHCNRQRPALSVCIAGTGRHQYVQLDAGSAFGAKGIDWPNHPVDVKLCLCSIFVFSTLQELPLAVQQSLTTRPACSTSSSAQQSASMVTCNASSWHPPQQTAGTSCWP